MAQPNAETPDLDLYDVPTATATDAQTVKAWTARILACLTYAAIAAIHPDLKTLAPGVRDQLRGIFVARRDWLMALRDLPSLWFGVWSSMAQGIFQRASERGGYEGLLPLIAAVPEAVPTEVTDRTIAVDMAAATSYEDTMQALATALQEAEDSGPTEDLTHPDTLLGYLGAITTEAQANAETQGLGSMAGGQLRGVGFSSKEGYINALAHGVKAATAAQYTSILRDQYRLSDLEIGQLTVTIIPDANLPIGAGIKHVAQGPSIYDAPRAQRASIMASLVGTAAPTVQEVHTGIREATLVAGAKEEGSGVLTGWAGFGELSRGRLEALFAEHGFDPSMLPAPKSAHAHAGFALGMLNGGGYVVRADRGGRRVGQLVMSNDGVPRKFQARWVVVVINHGVAEVGSHAGTTVMTAVLMMDGRLELSGPANLVDKVREDYTRRVATEVYPAAEITLWLRSLLRTRYGAIRLGGNWYIPHKYAEQGEHLATAIGMIWGTDWMLPALPVSTCSQLKAGLAKSLIQEAADVLSDLEAQRVQARKATPPKTEVGSAAATTLVGRLKVIAMRINDQSRYLGSDVFSKAREAVMAAVAVLEPICSDTSIRAELIRQEMGW